MGPLRRPLPGRRRRRPGEPGGLPGPLVVSWPGEGEVAEGPGLPGGRDLLQPVHTHRVAAAGQRDAAGRPHLPPHVLQPPGGAGRPPGHAGGHAGPVQRPGSSPALPSPLSSPGRPGSHPLSPGSSESHAGPRHYSLGRPRLLLSLLLSGPAGRLPLPPDPGQGRGQPGGGGTSLP